MLRMVANTEVCEFEDGRHLGPHTKPAKLASKEQERVFSFTDFLPRMGAILANTWRREGMVGEATKQPWHKSELLAHDEERDTRVNFVAVRATSCVQRCEVDHSVDT